LSAFFRVISKRCDSPQHLRCALVAACGAIATRSRCASSTIGAALVGNERDARDDCVCRCALLMIALDRSLFAARNGAKKNLESVENVLQ